MASTRGAGQRAAVRGHDRQRCRHAGFLQLAAEIAEIPAHARRHVGVERGGREALILPELGQHLGRGRNRRLGKPLGDNRRASLLVLGIGVGVQEADRHRVDALFRQPARDRIHLGLVEGPHHRSIDAQPLLHLDALRPRHQRADRRRLDIVHGHAVAAADDQHVLVAGGDEDGEPCSIALQRRVGGDRGAVHHAPELLGFHPQSSDAGEDTFRLVAWCGGRLQHLKLAGRHVEQHQVRERAADVDPEPEHP